MKITEWHHTIYYTCLCVWFVVQSSSLKSLMRDIQIVYTDNTNAELYRLRVPVVGENTPLNSLLYCLAVMGTNYFKSSLTTVVNYCFRK